MGDFSKGARKGRRRRLSRERRAAHLLTNMHYKQSIAAMRAQAHREARQADEAHKARQKEENRILHERERQPRNSYDYFR